MIEETLERTNQLYATQEVIVLEQVVSDFSG